MIFYEILVVILCFLLCIFFGVDFYTHIKLHERIKQLEDDNIEHKYNYGSLVSSLVSYKLTGDKDV